MTVYLARKRRGPLPRKLDGNRLNLPGTLLAETISEIEEAKDRRRANELLRRYLRGGAAEIVEMALGIPQGEQEERLRALARGGIRQEV